MFQVQLQTIPLKPRKQPPLLNEKLVSDGFRVTPTLARDENTYFLNENREQRYRSKYV